VAKTEREDTHAVLASSAVADLLTAPRALAEP
jgi:hypothetical protein